MKKLSLVLGFLLITLSMIHGQHSETRSVRAFKTIQVSSGIDLYLSQENNQSVKVESKKDQLDNVITEVKGDALIIKLDKKGGSWSWNNSNVRVYVRTATLEALSASGGSDVYGQTAWKLDDFKIQASGGSDMDLEITASDISIQSSGGSDIELSGAADILKIQSSGGSDINAKKLIVKSADIRSSGASDVSIHVTDKLVVEASGASDVTYKGNPKIKDISSTSSSDVYGYR